MRTANIPATATITALLLLAAWLGACDNSARQDPPIAVTASTAPAYVTAPAPAPAVAPANTALAVAVASDQASRAAREQTLRVQRLLIEQRRATRDAAHHGNPNERCLEGQKMRRVANGWVQAGAC